MATTMLTAAASTKDPLPNELKVSMRDKITFLDVDDSQFTTMLMDPRLGKESADSYKEEWLEDVYVPRLGTLGAGITAATDTQVAVASGASAYFRVGDIVRVTTTGEALLVQGTSGTTWQLIVLRGVGAVAAITATSGSGAELVIVSHADNQGATLPPILMTQRTTNYNYTQIHRHSYGFTRTAMQTQWYGGPLLDKERAKKLVEHKRGIEQTLFFGARAYSAGTAPTTPLHTAGGLVEYIATNIQAVSADFDKAELQTFLEQSLQYGSSDKVLFAAPRVTSVMSQFLANNWVRAGADEEVWGVKLSGVISGAFGQEIPVVTKKAWGNFAKGTATQYGSHAFLIDMQNVQYLTLQDTVQLRNRQAPDYDGIKEEYLTEFTCRVEQEATHSRWTGIST